MVDFARLTGIHRKRDSLFQAWVKDTWPDGDWNKLPLRDRELIVMAFNRGFGQGFATGTDYDD